MTYINNINFDDNFFSHTIVTLTIIWVSLNMANLTINNFKRFFSSAIKVYNEICENNPFILDYSDEKKIFEENVQLSIADDEKDISVNEEKYELKYLEKFKTFPNEYLPFNEEEITLANKIFEELKKNRIELNMKIINELRKEQDIVKNIINSVENAEGPLTDKGLKIMIDYDSYISELDLNDEDEKQAILETYDEIKLNLQENEKELEELEKTLIYDENLNVYLNCREAEDELREKAYQTIINNRIKNLMNSVLLEMTPIGNVFMRYNSEKGSFEYFSNHSIPYRYLEPIGRKYVMTFWCKPLFIDLEQELKRAEEKFDEEKKKEEERKEQEKQRKIQESISGINTKKSVIAKLKNYNNVSTNSTTNKPSLIPKNRGSGQTFALPPQIKANLPDISNGTSDKQLLKENANRYTWEGRFQDFCIIKKIDKKIVDKKLNMSWAEFKKMQEQNKK
jgi:hypothetical protein